MTPCSVEAPENPTLVRFFFSDAEFRVRGDVVDMYPSFVAGVGLFNEILADRRPMGLKSDPKPPDGGALFGGRGGFET
jgi:hypothetical protein